VVSTRDCSLQRRYQKVVEEAPAPFLTEDQTAQLYAASKDIIREAEYVGAGTCEFLVGKDGLISFLEVNTRLQVEHPVTEQVTGVDLVREQFRIAAGEKLRLHADPAPRGHSIEFRINGEDPGRNFLPAPGTVTLLRLPEGPGVRVDTGVESGSVIGGNFDSLLAKVIITGETRTEALERARRALDEMVVEGMATALPFHRLIVRDPAFTAEPFTVHTRWIETEWSNTVTPFTGGEAAVEDQERETVVVEVGGKRLEVSLPAGFSSGTPAAAPARGRAPRRSRARTAAAAAGGDALTSPMQGTIVKIAVADGDTVAEGDTVVVLEAMKMEQPLTAHKAGTITGLTASVGDVVTAGATICTLTS
jgi:acetyl-CoA/propionyl-CoA carboxylase, biotin carboxylase, biotin carboxyl carrier protein